jgi:transposase-like protein
MTKKIRRTVSPEQRKRITLALMEPRCDVGSLAKKYNLARSTLLRYRQQYRKQQSGDLLLNKKPHGKFYN